MKAILLCVILLLPVTRGIGQTIIPSNDIQIQCAVLAAPADKRDSATVYGYTDKKEWVLLRQGTNELVCLADDPDQPGFSVACYHRDLEPFMLRGRQLRKQGKKSQEIFEIREKEVKAGHLPMPAKPTMLYVLSCSKDNYNPSSGTIKNGYLRYVVYVPYATAESTGIPLKPQAPGMPFLMHPGTHGAHIMINPPTKEDF